MDVLWFTNKLLKEEKKKKAQTFTSENRGALKILPRQSSCEVFLHFQKSN